MLVTWQIIFSAIPVTVAPLRKSVKDSACTVGSVSVDLLSLDQKIVMDGQINAGVPVIKIPFTAPIS